MFHPLFLFKSLLRINKGRDSITKTQHSLIQNPFFKSISNISKSSLTLNYLKNSCGLSPESALRVAQQINLKTTTRPDSVLTLLKNHGFTKTQISKLITKHPFVLLSDPHKNLKPKFEFFNNMGISGTFLTNIISADPNILARSLENKIIPSFNFLLTLIPNDIGSICNTIRRSTWILHSIETRMGPSIGVLRNHGVPNSSISRLITYQPRTLAQKADQVNKTVLQLKEMSFSPSNLVFVRGFAVLSGVKKSAWEAKCAVLKSFGWSDKEIMSVFRKQPIVMAASVEKIRTSLDFFMNKLNWTQTEIFKFPTVLLLGMEKRIIPRCRVTQVLLSKGLIKKKRVGSSLIVAEDVFLKNFVIKYQKEAPELMKLYHKN